MLRATDVWFAYGQAPVLRGVTLTVARGGIVGILGPNGSGKTTLLRILAGTRQPQKGTVTIDDAPLSGGEQQRVVIAAALAQIFPRDQQNFRL